MMTSLALIAALATRVAADPGAEDCQVQTLQDALFDATPQGVAGAFASLADCDADAARVAAPKAFEKVLSGEGGNALVVRAIEVGAVEPARSWIASLQSDERSRTIAGIGDACGESEAVTAFLVESREEMGEDFWTERWYRSLAECREPAIQALLQEAVDAGSQDRTRFFGVLEVYARNLGVGAVPTLEALVQGLDDAEEMTYIVNAFADAAQVGSLDGQDPEATKAAITAIRGLAPELPARALDQARTTLLSLGDEGAANAIAGYRYAEQKGGDGLLHYGLIAVETAACKKGETWLGLHVGEAVEDGDLWPDQILAAAEAAVEGQWTFELAKKCKGTAEIRVLVTDGPLADPAAIQAWADEQLEALRASEVKKTVEYAPEPLKI